MTTRRHGKTVVALEGKSQNPRTVNSPRANRSRHIAAARAPQKLGELKVPTLGGSTHNVDKDEIRNFLTDKFFGDGPPTWIVSKGRPWERRCDTLADATAQQDKVVRKLNWHAANSGCRAAKHLATKLGSCKRERRCLSGACPICIRGLQRWFVVTTAEERKNWNDPHAQTLSVVPDFGRVKMGALSTFNWNEFCRRSAQALAQCGIQNALLAVDFSLDHFEGVGPKFFQIQLWGLFDEPNQNWKSALIECVNASKVVSNPVYARRTKRPRAAAAYGLKGVFNRRVSFVDDQGNRRDERTCLNTRNRDLNGPAWVELMIFLDRIGLVGRLHLHSNHDLGAPTWDTITSHPRAGSPAQVLLKPVIGVGSEASWD